MDAQSKINKTIVTAKVNIVSRHRMPATKTTKYAGIWTSFMIILILAVSTAAALFTKLFTLIIIALINAISQKAQRYNNPK